MRWTPPLLTKHQSKIYSRTSSQKTADRSGQPKTWRNLWRIALRSLWSLPRGCGCGCGCGCGGSSSSATATLTGLLGTGGDVSALVRVARSLRWSGGTAAPGQVERRPDGRTMDTEGSSESTLRRKERGGRADSKLQRKRLFAGARRIGGGGGASSSLATVSTMLSSLARLSCSSASDGAACDCDVSWRALPRRMALPDPQLQRITPSRPSTCAGQGGDQGSGQGSGQGSELAGRGSGLAALIVSRRVARATCVVMIHEEAPAWAAI